MWLRSTQRVMAERWETLQSPWPRLLHAHGVHPSLESHTPSRTLHCKRFSSSPGFFSPSVNHQPPPSPLLLKSLSFKRVAELKNKFQLGGARETGKCFDVGLGINRLSRSIDRSIEGNRRCKHWGRRRRYRTRGREGCAPPGKLHPERKASTLDRRASPLTLWETRLWEGTSRVRLNTECWNHLERWRIKDASLSTWCADLQSG